eukprot:2717151-Lingulodinium_polyedra.AAC.1
MVVRSRYMVRSSWTTTWGNQWMLAQYYVTDARAPVIVVSGANHVGYDARFRGKNGIVSFNSAGVATLKNADGL